MISADIVSERAGANLEGQADISHHLGTNLGSILKNYFSQNKGNYFLETVRVKVIEREII